MELIDQRLALIDLLLQYGFDLVKERPFRQPRHSYNPVIPAHAGIQRRVALAVDK